MDETISTGLREEPYAPSSSYESRNWGRFWVLGPDGGNQGNTCDVAKYGAKVKILEVDPASMLSMQKHEHRDEYWVVLEGHGMLIRAEHFGIDKPTATHLNRGKFALIKARMWHKLVNISQTKPLVLAEIQLGLAPNNKVIMPEETDIRRFEENS